MNRLQLFAGFKQNELQSSTKEIYLKNYYNTNKALHIIQCLCGWEYFGYLIWKKQKTTQPCALLIPLLSLRSITTASLKFIGAKNFKALPWQLSVIQPTLTSFAVASDTTCSLWKEGKSGQMNLDNACQPKTT